MTSTWVIGLLMSLTVAGALLAVACRNILHAILGLGLALLGIAGLFLSLNSPFVAMMEVLVYVGGISVAMIFAIMLSTVTSQAEGGARRQGFAATISLLFFATLAVLITQTSFDTAAAVPVDHQAWSVESLGENLLTRFNLVFETLSIILLLAIVGAISIARRTQELSMDQAGPSEPAALAEKKLSGAPAPRRESEVVH